MGKRKTGGVLQLTNKDLVDMVLTGVYQVEYIDLNSSDRVIIEGCTVDVDGAPDLHFSLPCNPVKFFAKMAEKGSGEPLVTSTAAPAKRRVKTKKVAEETETDVEVAADNTRKRRKRDPITNELVDAEQAALVADALKRGGSELEARLRKEYARTGTYSL